MKPHFPTLFMVFLLSACGTTPTGNSALAPGHDRDERVHPVIDPLDTMIVMNEDTANHSYDTFHVVVADTGAVYHLLRARMVELSEQQDLDIDTMGRSFNTNKNLITLPDDDEDELYAGACFPRRFPSEHLSLEYLHFYREAAGDKTIALVTGIYGTAKEAESALGVLRQAVPQAFGFEAEVYVGCMH